MSIIAPKYNPLKHQKISIPQSVKGIIFDLDGTLIDSMPIHFEAYCHVLSSYGVEYDWETFTGWAGIPSDRTFQLIKEKYDVKDLDVQQACDDKRRYYSLNAGNASVIEPVFQIARENFGEKSMSIGTGSHYEMASKSIKELGLDKYISILVTYEDVKNPKPHPDTFLRCAELMELSPSDCIVLEDGIQGIRAAEAAGMAVIDVRDYL